MKMPGQRPGFQISDILGLNEGKGLEPTATQSSLGGCSLELPPYAPPHHPYSHELLRHHQPWLALDHHESNGEYYLSAITILEIVDLVLQSRANFKARNCWVMILLYL